VIVSPILGFAVEIYRACSPNEPGQSIDVITHIIMEAEEASEKYRLSKV
jgi:hypothetical protein